MTPAERKRLFDLYRAGKPVRKIAELLNRRQGTVTMAISRAAKRGEIRSRKKGPLPKPDGEVVYREVRTVCFLDEQTHRTLKITAAGTGKAMSWIVREALKEYFERHPVKL